MPIISQAETSGVPLLKLTRCPDPGSWWNGDRCTLEALLEHSGSCQQSLHNVLVPRTTPEKASTTRTASRSSAWPRTSSGRAGALPAPSQGSDVPRKAQADERVSKAIGTRCSGKPRSHLCVCLREERGCGLKQQGLMQMMMMIIIITSSPISQCSFLQENSIQHANTTIKATRNIPLTRRCQNGAVKVRGAGDAQTFSTAALRRVTGKFLVVSLCHVRDALHIPDDPVCLVFLHRSQIQPPSWSLTDQHAARDEITALGQQSQKRRTRAVHAISEVERPRSRGDPDVQKAPSSALITKKIEKKLKNKTKSQTGFLTVTGHFTTNPAEERHGILKQNKTKKPPPPPQEIHDFSSSLLPTLSFRNY